MKSNVYTIMSKDGSIFEIDARTVHVEERVCYQFKDERLELICSYNVYNYDIINVQHGKGKRTFEIHEQTGPDS